MKRVLSVILVFAVVLTMFPVGQAAAFTQAGSGTGERVVTEIKVINPPKLVYTAREGLNLGPYGSPPGDEDDGLFVVLQFSEGDPEYVGYSDFENWGITTDPAHGTILTTAHNGQGIKVSCGGAETYTDALQVTAEPLEGADLWPASASFNKNPAYQADVITEIQWWHNVLTVAEVKKAGTAVGAENYSVTRDSENKDFLTIKKEYLAAQPVGELVLTVEFTGGSSAQLTIAIQDTTGIAPPFWPAGSALTASNVTHNAVYLSWTPAQDDLAVTEYRIYQDGTLIQALGSSNAFEVTGLLPSTTYSFQVQAGDGNGQWTTDGPTVTVTTNPEVVSEITRLGLNAPRYTIEGHLFMGDTVKIEISSNQSGLSPQVTVSYKEWNGDRTAVEDKTSTLTLVETPSGSKKYAADFTLSEGICQVTALKGKLKPDSSPYEINVNNRVAGRIKLTVEAPAGLDSEQIGFYNELMKNTYAVAYKTNSSVSFTSETKDPEKSNEFTIEGVSGNDNFQAAAYELKHYKEALMIYEDEGTVSVQDGLESVCQYSIDCFAHLKVRVVDDATGEPIANALVRGPLLIYVDGTRDYDLSTLTDSEGYAVTSGAYFAQNLRRDARLELVVNTAQYESKTEIIEAGSLTVGVNTIEIRLKRALFAYLRVRVVDDATGEPVADALVKSPLVMYANGTQDYNLSVRTAGDGYAAMSSGYFAQNLQREAGLKLVVNTAQYESKTEIIEAGSLAVGENTIEIRLQRVPSAHLKVRVVDDATGEPVANALVKSPGLIYVDGTLDHPLFAWTAGDGYAATSGAYFAQNLRRDARLELVADAAASLYEGKVEIIESGYLAVGENTIEIRLQKVPLVTLQGTVTDTLKKPLKQVFVCVPLTASDGTDISVTALTDENGRYTLQVPQTATAVSFSLLGGRIESESLTLQDGVNTLNFEYSGPTGKVKVILEAKDNFGNITQLDLNRMLLGFITVSISNRTQGSFLPSFVARDLMYRNGHVVLYGDPGDEILVRTNSLGREYEEASATVYLDEDNYAEARLVLTSSPKITAKVVDQNGNPRLNEPRYMYLYNKDGDGGFVSWESSYLPGIISKFVPAGVYRAVFSWEGSRGRYFLKDWENEPECFISESFGMVAGEVTDLGTVSVNYSASDPFFRQNTAAGVTSSRQEAIPGSVVTLRVGYDYDNLKTIDGSKLDLAARIPADTVLVEGSVSHRSSRGNTDSVQPVISGDRIILDLKDHIAGAAGVLTYQVRINSSATVNSISAGAELKFTAEGSPVSEGIGFVEIPCQPITLYVPPEISEKAKAEPVRLSGLAPANNKVELYDGSVKIGETQAAPSGVWLLNVVLPDRGTPIYHQLTASTMVDNLPYTAAAALLVGRKSVEMTDFVLGMADDSSLESFVRINPQQINIEFPLVVHSVNDNIKANVSFSDNDKVSNVKIAGKDAVLQDGVFQARFRARTTPVITVEYKEEATQPEEILKYDFGIVPDYLREAEAEFTDSSHTAANTRVVYGADGYLSEFLLPEVKLSALDGYGTVSMELETESFDPANAQNRTNLGNGMYGYDFSAELVNGKYVITGYLDRGLLPKQVFEAVGKRSNMRMAVSGAAAGLGFVKSTIEVAGEGEALLGAFGDLSKAARMAHLLNEYESIRPNIEPHLQEYYDKRIAMMGEDILMGKTLGFIQDGVAEAANLVPLAGQVVCGLAKYISGKLLGDMFDNEFESDYNSLISELTNLLGSPDWDDDNQQWEDPWLDGRVEKDPETGLCYYYPPRRKARPHYIYDPSGYVYEAVEENRISGVTATVLFLPKDKAETAAEAKTCTDWQVWNAEWYLQENPQTTDAEGKYAWDVPEGWWMVQFIKDGYQTAYSDALPVPPPQLDVNIPMMQLAKPAVDKVIWGNGGRYIDVYFTKYMDTRSLEATNAFRLADVGGNSVAGTVSYPEGVKTGVDGSGVSGLNLTKVARFTPSAPLTADVPYTLTVNRAVADYAAFSLAVDYTETETVSAAGALIAGLSGTDITVEPGQDITQDLTNALTFTSVNPGDENLLDNRVVFVSANTNVVRITPDGKATSLGEGTAQISVTSVDDPEKTGVFTVTVAYPPSPVRVAKMVIKASDGRALTALNLSVGSTYTLNPVISPANAANQTMSYYSDNPAVASVDAGGRIQAIAKGIATITAKTVDKNIRQMIHVTVTAAAPVNPGNDSGGGGNTPTTPAYNADVKAGSGSKTILPVTVNKDSGSASINISAQSGLVSDGTVITIPSIPGVDTYSVGIPVADLSTTDGQGALILNTDAGSITVPSNMLTGVKGISGSKAEISIGKGNKSDLPENVRDAIGDKPLIRLMLSIDGRQTDWSNPNAPVTVSIPYTPTAAELANPESIVIWYIDGAGNVATIPNGRYDAATGTVTFNTTHFSDYAVAYNKVSFNDVPAGAWYAPAVSFIAAREITTGTGNGKYSPDAQLSRGEFIVLMMRAYGIAPDTGSADNFSDAGNTYYTGYLAAAKRLGITAGAGNNMYAPSKEITRQEMFTLLYNALKVIGHLPQGDSDKTLDHFSDAGQIDSWAKEAMILLVKTGTVGGSNGKLSPLNTTTRSEMAQVLYNLLGK